MVSIKETANQAGATLSHVSGCLAVTALAAGRGCCLFLAWKAKLFRMRVSQVGCGWSQHGEPHLHQTAVITPEALFSISSLVHSCSYSRMFTQEVLERFGLGNAHPYLLLLFPWSATGVSASSIELLQLSGRRSVSCCHCFTSRCFCYTNSCRHYNSCCCHYASCCPRSV